MGLKYYVENQNKGKNAPSLHVRYALLLVTAARRLLLIPRHRHQRQRKVRQRQRRKRQRKRQRDRQRDREIKYKLIHAAL